MQVERLTVGVTAVLDCHDLDRIAQIVEPDAEVANSKPKLGRVNVPKTLYFAFPGCKKAGQSVEDAKCLTWLMARSCVLAWAVQTIFLPTIIGPSRGIKEVCGPCDRSLLR